MNIKNKKIYNKCPECNGEGIKIIYKIKQEPCPECNGTAIIKIKCTKCNGKGLFYENGKLINCECENGIYKEKWCRNFQKSNKKIYDVLNTFIDKYNNIKSNNVNYKIFLNRYTRIDISTLKNYYILCIKNIKIPIRNIKCTKCNGTGKIEYRPFNPVLNFKNIKKG